MYHVDPTENPTDNEKNWMEYQRRTAEKQSKGFLTALVVPSVGAGLVWAIFFGTFFLQVLCGVAIGVFILFCLVAGREHRYGIFS